MKSYYPNIEYRIRVRQNKTEGIQNFDMDNIYPQRVREIVKASGTASNCVNVYNKFMRGNGFTDSTFAKTKINRVGLTPDKLLRETAADYALWRGFAWLIKYDALCNVSEVHHIPFEFCRLVDEMNVEAVGCVAVYDDWDRYKRRTILKQKIDFIPVYNPDKMIIAEQMEKAGGITKYKGQVLWYSIEKEYYPIAIYDPVIEDILTDAGIKTYRLRNVTTGFMPSQLVELPYEMESEEERNELIEDLKTFQGAENANRLMLLENKNASSTPIKITKFDVQDNDKMFQVTYQTSKESIVEVFSMPPILAGIQVAGKLGNSSDLQDAYNYYNIITTDERSIISDRFKDVFSRAAVPLNPTGDWSISMLAYNNAVINSISDIAGKNLIMVLESTIPLPQKISALIILFGISKEDAEAMAATITAPSPTVK